MARAHPNRRIDEIPGTFGYVKQRLRKAGYGVFGNHSAVQLCNWTKQDIKGTGQCWKAELYGIKSSGCCQMSPAVAWCDHHCVHCWRANEIHLGLKEKYEDSPSDIIEGIINARKNLLRGLGGDPRMDPRKLREAMDPMLFTFSLSGEATLYPRLGEMIDELRKRGKITFIVTNGVNPEAVKKLIKMDQLPTQLTISVNAPNENLYKKWHRPIRPDSWKRFNETLLIMSKLSGKTRRVIRLTLVKPGLKDGLYKDLTNMTDKNVKEYVSMIRKADADFIHVKGFKSIGAARKRMPYDKQPLIKEIKEYSEKILEELNKDSEEYETGGVVPRSTVVMLKKRSVEAKISKV